MTNHRLAFFFEQFNQFFLFGNEGINLGGFMVEEVGNLFFNIKKGRAIPPNCSYDIDLPFLNYHVDCNAYDWDNKKYI
jgi:hypothetical protein